MRLSRQEYKAINKFLDKLEVAIQMHLSLSIPGILLRWKMAVERSRVNRYMFHMGPTDGAHNICGQRSDWANDDINMVKCPYCVRILKCGGKLT